MVGQVTKAPGEVERLVAWAYRDQQVEACGADRRMAGLFGGRSNVLGIGQVLALGAVIDGCGGVHLPPDRAVEVADAVAALPDVAAALVARHGRAGTRPEWRAEVAMAWVPERDAQGALRVRTEMDGQAVGRHVRVSRDFDLSIVEVNRRTWLVWWEALRVLAGRLGVAGPAASRAPWLFEPLLFEAG